jgi:hypothetical protein
MAIRAAALVAAAAVMLAFTTAPGERTGVRTCSERAEVVGPAGAPTPTANDLWVGRRLWLAGARRADFHFDYRDDGDLWLKSLAIVRAGRDVTLRVPRFERARLGLRYDGDATRVEDADVAVVIKPCPRRMKEWTYYPGGFLFKRPGCYALDVRIEGASAHRYRLALGRGASCAAR